MRSAFFACAFALTTSLMLSTPAFSAFSGPVGAGGFQGPTTSVETDTVAKAKSARDDVPVMLTGHITQRVAGSDDKYVFQDSTGEIIVDIDQKLFVNRTVTPADTVRLSGEVDKDMFEDAEIDVKQLEIMN